ncbi:hypothetical protein NPIL_63211 [Nephila pilipes]|uniref:Uncharacterized protein n=1 Tax=Nephila pilipes TaxID=299642 RepID=A0A8X6PMY9_NEPPI|nr:hypothetical protein NPIL_63211 [Nephila pilipes]
MCSIPTTILRILFDSIVHLSIPFATMKRFHRSRLLDCEARKSQPSCSLSRQDCERALTTNGCCEGSHHFEDDWKVLIIKRVLDRGS